MSSAPPIVGVRVHFNDARSPIVHEAGRSYASHTDSGNLHIYAEDGTRTAIHASMEWAWAELVHAEPAAENIGTIDTAKVASITFSGPAFSPDSLGLFYGRPAPEPTLAERIENAEKALAAKRREQSRSKAEHALRVADAEVKLAELRKQQAEQDEAA